MKTTTLRQALHARNYNFKRRRNFLRQEYHRYVRLQGAKWRKPRGMHSKLRLSIGPRQLVRVGFGTDSRVRHLSREGLPFSHVRNLSDAHGVPQGSLAVISSALGRRKRIEALKVLSTRGIRVQ